MLQSICHNWEYRPWGADTHGPGPQGPGVPGRNGPSSL